MFGYLSTGVIYAFDTNGNPVNVFPDGTNRTVSAAAPIAAGGVPFGLAFSPLDVNLWHVTLRELAKLVMVIPLRLIALVPSRN